MRVYQTAVRRIKAIEPSHVDDYYWAQSPASITVLQDDTPRDTGLLDERGNPIMSVEVMQPIGFTR
jgi:hypothetical protein